MADETRNLETIFTANVTGFMEAITALETRLKTLIQKAEAFGTASSKSAEDAAKAQKSFANELDKTSKLTADLGTKLKDGLGGATQATEKQTVATVKSGEKLASFGKTFQEVREEMTAFNAVQRTHIANSEMSLPVYEKLSSKMAVAKQESVGYRKALYDEAMGANTTRLSFDQFVSSLDKTEKTLHTTKTALLANKDAYGMTTTEINKWFTSVNRGEMAQAFLNERMYSSNGILMSAKQSFMGVGDAVKGLTSSYDKLYTSNTSFGKEIRKTTEDFQKFGGNVKTLEQQFFQTNRAFEEANKASLAFDKSLDKLTVSQQKVTDKFSDLLKSNTVYGQAARELKNTTDLSTKGLNDYGSGLAALNNKLNESITRNAAYAASTKKLTEEQDFLLRKNKDLIASGTEQGQKALQSIVGMEDTKQALRMTRLEVAELTKSWKESTVGMDVWNKTSKTASASSVETATFVSSLSEKIKSGGINYKEATTKLNEHIASVQKAGPEVGKFGQFMAGLHSKFTGMAATINNATGYFYNLGHAIVSMATWIPAAIIIGTLSEAIAKAVTDVVQFDQSLKSLQAISGGTEAEIALLGKEILRISDTTKYSASEIAKGAIYIAQAGFSASESLQVIGAAAKGAQATLESLETSADLLTTVLRAFHIEASDSSSVMDMLSMAANKSKTNLEGMRTVFNYLGPAAYSAGVGLNESLGALMALSNVGMKMSTIGTSLRQVFIGLENPSSKLKDALQRLGMTTDDLSVKKMGGLLPVLQNLNKVIGGSLTNAVQFFSVRAGNAALIISQMNEHVAMMIKYTQEYGATAIMAGKQTEGLSVQVSILSNRFQNFIIRMSEGGLTDSLKGLISVANGLITAIEYLVNNPFTNFIITMGVTSLAIKAAIGLFSLIGTAIVGVGTSALITAVRVMGLKVVLEALFDRLLSKTNLIIVALSLLVAAFYAFTKSNAEHGKVLQENSIEFANNANMATKYAETLRNTSKDSDNYNGILRKIKDIFPELTKEMVVNKDSLEGQAQALDRVAAKYQGLSFKAASDSIKVLSEEYKKSGYEIEVYSTILGENRNQLLQVGYGITSFLSIVPNLIGSLMGIDGATENATKHWANLKLAWNTTSSKAGVQAAEELSAAAKKQMEIFPQVASVIINSSKTSREALLKLIPDGEMKSKVQMIVKDNDQMTESLKINANEAKKVEINAVSEMGAKWIEHYALLEGEEASSYSRYATWSKKKIDIAMKAYAKENSDTNLQNAERLRLEEEYYQKYFENLEKHAQKVISAIQKIGADREKLYKEQLTVGLQSIEVHKKAEISALKEIDTTTDVYLRRKFEIENKYEKQSIALIDEETSKRLESQKKINDSIEAYIKTISDPKVKEGLKAEAVRQDAEKIAAIWKDQLTNYKTHIDQMEAKSKEYSDKYLAALANIAAAEEKLAGRKQSLEEKKREAVRLTMTEEQKEVDKINEFDETLKKGYVALAEAETISDNKAKQKKLVEAENYFTKAEGMITSLTKTTTDADGKIQTNNESTKTLRINAANEIEAAYVKVRNTTVKGEQDIADAAKASFNTVREEITFTVNKYTELQKLFETKIVLALDTNKGIEDLKVLMGYVNENKDKFQVVINFLGSASPVDKLDIIIEEVKNKLNLFKTNLLEINKGNDFVINFKGYGTSAVLEYLSNAYILAESGAKWLVQQIKALSDAGIVFLVYFKGNDGTTTTGISAMITSVYTQMVTLSAKINALVTVHTIKTKNVTEGSSSSSGSVQYAEGGSVPVQYAEGGSVPGEGSGDTVPAMLTPGEFVVRKGVVNSLGEGFFHMINSMKGFTMPKFNVGGIVQSLANGGSVQKSSTEIFTLNLQAGNSNIPLKVIGNANTMRNQIKALEKELGRMRLSHA